MAIPSDVQATLKEMADAVVQEMIPEAVTTIETLLPPAFQGLVSMIVSPMLPAIEAKLRDWVDAKIAAM